jgi:hypothetical protein
MVAKRLEEVNENAVACMQLVFDLYDSIGTASIGDLIDVIRLATPDLNSVRALQIPMCMFTHALAQVERERNGSQTNG